jgi:regulatory protein
MEAAAAYLAARPRSVDEMRRRLRHLGYRAELCDEAVARLVDLGYLDDAAFARAWVERRDHSRPRGEVALRRELRARGIPDEAIAIALADRRASGGSRAAAEATGGNAGPLEMAMSGDEQAAWRLIERRRASLEREPDPRRRRDRAYALLARNGFDPDVCREVARRAVIELGT